MENGECQFFKSCDHRPTLAEGDPETLDEAGRRYAFCEDRGTGCPSYVAVERKMKAIDERFREMRNQEVI